MTELTRSGCVRRKCESPRNALSVEKYRCNSSVLPRHNILKETESRRAHLARNIYTPENRRTTSNNLYKKSPSGNRLTAPRPYKTSNNSLYSPSLLGLKMRTLSSAEENYGSYKNSSSSYFSQDNAAYKAVQMNIADCERPYLYYSRSELDTDSICGRCGESKLCGSPELFLNASQNNRMDMCSGGFRNKMPFSPMSKRSKMTRNSLWGMKPLLDRSDTTESDERGNKNTFVKSFSRFRKSHSHPALLKLLCWRNHEDDVHSAGNRSRSLDLKRKYVTYDIASDTLSYINARVNVMLQYSTDKNELHVTLLEAFNIVKDISKPVAVFTKICLMPGKQQTKFSKRRYQTCDPVFEEEFYFNIDLKEAVPCGLKIKFYNKPGLFSSSEALGTCIIPLYQHNISSDAKIICQELTK